MCGGGREFGGISQQHDNKNLLKKTKNKCITRTKKGNTIFRHSMCELGWRELSFWKIKVRPTRQKWNNWSRKMTLQPTRLTVHTLPLFLMDKHLHQAGGLQSSLTPKNNTNHRQDVQQLAPFNICNKHETAASTARQDSWQVVKESKTSSLQEAGCQHNTFLCANKKGFCRRVLLNAGHGALDFVL